MDYHVAFFQDSWTVEQPIGTEGVVQHVLDTRDAAIKQLQLPGVQQDKVDHVSTGVWLEVRTDRPRPSSTTTEVASVIDQGLHRSTPFSFIQLSLQETEIRLFELFPGSQGDLLRGRLIKCALDSAPVYTALSYTWGGPEAKGRIMLGDPHAQAKLITENLQSALNHIRSAERSHLLWVDAICIDQYNVHERNHQVAMMGTIFASASEVRIWLGDKADYSQFGMNVLGYLAAGRGFEDQPPWETLPPQLVHQGLQDILGRSWFHRIWTVQEAALSSYRTTIMCGNEILAWPADTDTLSLFVRGIKLAAISAQWTENGFAGAEDLGILGINLDGIIELLELQLQQIRRRLNHGKTWTNPIFSIWPTASETDSQQIREIGFTRFRVLR